MNDKMKAVLRRVMGSRLARMLSQQLMYLLTRYAVRQRVRTRLASTDRGLVLSFCHDSRPVYWTTIPDGNLTRLVGRMVQHLVERGAKVPTPDGCTVWVEWAVHSADGNVYKVNPPTEATAVREATLLYHGRPADPEDPPEHGCAPAYRHVLVAPDGRIADTGWKWPLGWTPPTPAPAPEPEPAPA